MLLIIEVGQMEVQAKNIKNDDCKQKRIFTLAT